MLNQKQIIIGIVVIALLLLGVGGFFLYSQNNKPQDQATNTESSATTSQEAGVMNSFIDLVTSGTTTQCTFNTAAGEGGSSNGTVYISGENMRGNFTTTTKDGKASQMYMIRNGDKYYMWGGELPSGIKMTLDINEFKTNTQASQYVDLNTKADYKCNPWTVDLSKFTPPSNIKFEDLSGMMQGYDTKTKEESKSPTVDSSVCDSITDASAKAACEAAISGE